MSDNSKIIKFPRISPAQSTSSDDYDDQFDDFEAWEPYAGLIEKEDYPGLVRYCEQEALRRPDDLYAQYYLGGAYFLNGDYERAIKFMSEHHRKYPWNADYQYVILDALYANGRRWHAFG